MSFLLYFYTTVCVPHVTTLLSVQLLTKMHTGGIDFILFSIHKTSFLGNVYICYFSPMLSFLKLATHLYSSKVEGNAKVNNLKPKHCKILDLVFLYHSIRDVALFSTHT